MNDLIYLFLKILFELEMFLILIILFINRIKWKNFFCENMVYEINNGYNLKF